MVNSCLQKSRKLWQLMCVSFGIWPDPNLFCQFSALSGCLSLYDEIQKAGDEGINIEKFSLLQMFRVYLLYFFRAWMSSPSVSCLPFPERWSSKVLFVLMIQPDTFLLQLLVYMHSCFCISLLRKVVNVSSTWEVWNLSRHFHSF